MLDYSIMASKVGNSQNSAICGYDVTIPETLMNLDEVRALMMDYAKKWVFQKEKSDNGYVHWQCRLSLIKKRRLTAIKGLKLGGHWSPTTCAVHEGQDFNYAMKADTRIAGPWKDDDEIKFETVQLAIFKTYKLRPYQQAIYDESQQFHMRNMNIIYDTVGNIGKSLFAEWMEYEGIAEEIPPFRAMEDIFQWVCSMPRKQCYFVDMPRGMKKDKLADFYSGLEVVKNGVAYDKRYKGRKVRFNRPRIFVFTNLLPNLNLMSKDRWKIWKINKDYTFDILSNKDIKKSKKDEESESDDSVDLDSEFEDEF